MSRSSLEVVMKKLAMIAVLIVLNVAIAGNYGTGGVAQGLSAQASSLRVPLRVVDGVTQQPVAGARVWAEPRDRSDSDVVVLTATDGVAALPLRSAHRILVVAAGGYATYRTSLARMAATTIRLEPEAIISGTMVSKMDDSPLSGSITSISYHPRNRVSRSVRVLNGRFELRGLLPGRLLLIGRAEGMAPTLLRLNLGSGTAYSAHLQLMRAVEIAGRATDDASLAVAGARVTVRYELPTEDRLVLESFIGGRVVTDADGRYVLTNVVPNVPFVVSAAKDGRRVDTIRLDLTPGERFDIGDLTLPRR
jgi:hypothetical protein